MPTGTVKWFNATKGMGSSFPTMGARTRSSTSPPSSGPASRNSAKARSLNTNWWPAATARKPPTISSPST